MLIATHSSEALYFCLFSAALVLSAFLTKWIRNVARRHGLVVGPLDGRHIHTQPVPRVGGISIYLTFTSLMLTLGFFAGHMPWGISVRSSLLILVPGTFLFLVGLYDDIKGLSAKLKFVAQLSAALMLYAAGFRLLGLPWGLAT